MPNSPSPVRAGRRPSPVRTPVPLAGLATVADLPRQQMAVATEGACAVFRGLEAMRRVQVEAARRALDRHTAAAQKLRAPCPPADLLAVQTELLGFALGSSVQYWQELGAIAVETQNELLGLASHLVDSEGFLHAAAMLDHFPAVPSP